MLTVWPVKSSPMSIKVAQKWFHWKNERFGHLYKNFLNVGNLGKIIVATGFEKLPKVQKSINLVTLHPSSFASRQKIRISFFSFKASVAFFPRFFRVGIDWPLSAFRSVLSIEIKKSKIRIRASLCIPFFFSSSSCQSDRPTRHFKRLFWLRQFFSLGRYGEVERR